MLMMCIDDFQSLFRKLPINWYQERTIGNFRTSNHYDFRKFTFGPCSIYVGDTLTSL